MGLIIQIIYNFSFRARSPARAQQIICFSKLAQHYCLRLFFVIVVFVAIIVAFVVVVVVIFAFVIVVFAVVMLLLLCTLLLLL